MMRWHNWPIWLLVAACIMLDLVLFATIVVGMW